LRAHAVATSFLLILSACQREARQARGPSDDLGFPIAVGKPATRIVSLNPATTDLMFALGAGRRLVGRTHWDLYPDSARFVPDLGPGLSPNVEAVIGAHPDLVVLYASQTNLAAATSLRAAGINTVSLRIDHIADFHRAALLLGRLVGDSARGALVSDSVRKTLERVRAATAPLSKPTVFWHIWDSPLITIGRGSYLNELVEIAGGRNVYANMADASPTVSIEDVLRRNPQFIIDGPEGSRKIEKDPKWSSLDAVKNGRVLVVDTAIVGRPSVRLGEAAVSIANLLHPGVIR
jgi:ABC-type Fe3+-hydroxamate transport system substrate-binding protein